MKTVIVLLSACASAPARTSTGFPERGEIGDVMARYDQLTKAVDGDGIAAMFVPDGVIANNDQTIAQGQDTIRTFLKSFTGKVEVVEAATTIETVAVDGERAHITGSFHQRDRLLPDGTELQPHGTYDADLVKTPSGWRFVRMHTVPSLK